MSRRATHLLHPENKHQRTSEQSENIRTVREHQTNHSKNFQVESYRNEEREQKTFLHKEKLKTKINKRKKRKVKKQKR